MTASEVVSGNRHTASQKMSFFFPVLWLPACYSFAGMNPRRARSGNAKATAPCSCAAGFSPLLLLPPLLPFSSQAWRFHRGGGVREAGEFEGSWAKRTEDFFPFFFPLPSLFSPPPDAVFPNNG